MGKIVDRKYEKIKKDILELGYHWNFDEYMDNVYFLMGIIEFTEEVIRELNEQP